MSFLISGQKGISYGVRQEVGVPKKRKKLINSLNKELSKARADIAELHQHVDILLEREKAMRAVMLEVKELMEIQDQRIEDLKAHQAQLEADKVQMTMLLKKAYDRLVDVETERKQLFSRLLAIIDVNIPEEPVSAERQYAVRRERH